VARAVPLAPPPDAARRLEAPPRTAGAVAVAIAALLVAVGAWLALAPLDVLVFAEGRIEPAGRARVVNHPEGGRVAAIYVREGARVRARQPLLLLEDGDLRSALAERRARRFVLLAEIARIEAERDGGVPAFPAELLAARPDLVAAQRELLASRRRADAESLRGLEQEVAARRAELRRLEAERAGLATQRELLAKQERAVRELADQGLYPRIEALARARELAALESRLQALGGRLARARAALAEAESRLAAFRADREARLGDRLGRLRAELATLETAIAELERRRRARLVTAPVAGFVRRLSVRAPGQAVAANAPLLEVVPSDEELVVRAVVANRDVGALAPGTPATLKVRAFDFTRYGTLRGRIRRIDADADPPAPGAEPVYRVEIVLDPATPDFATWRRRLQPGMVVDVEFHTGRRTLLDYFLAGVERVTGRALAER